ncbi:MAG TPA: nuclear transport factor 2 family protein [Geminicoccus sp.]|jgi:steroid delta-isomerase-like uncharacterized protein|uniref:ester cyclase n=1 Tax=Geminicoccus sp. TaxID=2024832 RepID=UPI002E309788|nr:nuclear transport factor 2 family protein [Geminicoccus sp.]HEX2529325.1 nuclear transport factor 2 family protein [Geminicoccus sp.]
MPFRRTLLAGAATGLATAALPLVAQEQDPVAVATAYVAAFSAHDAARATSLLAPDAVYLDVTIGEPQVGRDTIRSTVIDPYLKAVPDLHWEMRGAPIATGGRVAFEWRISGTNSGVWPEDVPASGHAFSLDGVSVMDVRDGLITSITDYYDGLSFQSQLGWVE